MEKGLSKNWTPEQEEKYESLLASSKNLAERYMVMMICNLLKYDQRTREAKKAWARHDLMLATASDDELRELAELQHSIWPGDLFPSVDKALQDLVERREKVRANGLPRNLISRGEEER